MKTLDQIELAENDRAAVTEAAALLSKRFPVEGVVLFGSKARGQGDEESDIDLLVLTSRRLAWAEQARMTRALSPIQRECGTMISLLIVASADWNEGLYQVLPIRTEVERDGVAA